MFYVIFYQKQFKFMHVMTNYAYYKREKVKITEQLEPIGLGEILLEEFMKPLNLSINQLSREIDVPARSIREIVNGNVQ